MRAVRAQDGSVYHISKADLPNPPTLEALHALLSEYAAIPLTALIVMHPNGRQTDRTSVGSLLAQEADDSDEGLVYLFDREALAVDLNSEDGQLLLEALDLNSDHVLDDVGHDPDKQYEAAIDLIQCIRHQHQALSAAIANLERHRGGRQDLITAYQHFASPLLTKYANLLAIYPSCMSLVEKVRVSSKMQASPSNSSARERLLSEFVSKEKMENVRDGCRRIYNELTRQNRELEDMLQNVASTTENLKNDVEQAYNVDDLLDCEKDATEAHARLKELFSRPGQRSEEEEDELDGLFDECIGRLRYLVDRRNVETRQLLHSLQEIAKLQGQIASAPVIINSLNGDLRTKCDTFKHLERLQLLVPAYAASLAESVRRRMFTKALRGSSSAYAELFSSLSNEERRRRGIYQAEWAGKLPWELPGLEEGLAFIEVELRSSNPSLGSVKQQNQTETHATMEDLDALEGFLSDIKENLSPEDMPSNGLQHPVQDALTLIKKLKKNIEALQAKFEKLNSKLEDPDQSPTTSVSVSNSANEALQAAEERRMQLERDLQAERGAREAEVAALQIKNSELERQLAEQVEHKASLVIQHKAEQDDLVQEHKTKAEDLQAEIDRLSERAAHLAGKNTMHQNEANRLRQQLQDAEDDTEELKRRLEEEETRSDHLENRKQDLLQSLNDKDRMLRDHRTESELDRATLEKELAEVKEKLDAVERESATHAASLAHDLEKLQGKVSSHESDYAELQTMCDERGRSIADMLAETQANKVRVATLLHLCQGYHQQCQDFLTQFVRKDLPKYKNRSSDGSITVGTPRIAATAASSNQIQVSVPAMDTLEQAIEYMESRQPYELWDQARAHCEHCISETFLWQKQCKRYKQRADKAVLTAKEKLAFTNFQVDDLALFLPTKNISERTFAAFNYGKPNHFLKPTGRLIEDMERKDWIVGKITSITEAVVDASAVTENNPYLLRPGSKYSMLEAEFWPARSSHRKTQSTEPTEALASAPNKEADADIATSLDGAFLANPANMSSSPPEETKAGDEDTSRTEREVEDTEPPMSSQPETEEGKNEPHYAGVLPSTMDFSIVKGPGEEAKRPAPLKPTGRSGTSSLSSSRPKDLPTMLDDAPSVPPLPDAIAEIQMTSPDPADEEPAFLARASPEAIKTSTSPQVIPRSTSLTASRQHSMAFSRSFGSSNGSGGSSGLRNRLSSSSFLTPSKALPTVASSPGVSSYMSSRTSPASPPQVSDASKANRYTQTIGRYSGRGSRSRIEGDGHTRQASASGATGSQSSARELLRSFTASSSGGT